MSSLHTMAIVFMAALLIFFIIIGIWAGKKNKTGGLDADVEYFLGGKTTPVFVLGMSYCASAVSAGSFIVTQVLCPLLDGHTTGFRLL